MIDFSKTETVISKDCITPTTPPTSGLCSKINHARNQIPLLRDCVESLLSLDTRINGKREHQTLGDTALPETDGMAEDLGRIADDISELALNIQGLIAGIHESL